jgi:hypothetical protein
MKHLSATLPVAWIRLPNAPNVKAKADPLLGPRHPTKPQSAVAQICNLPYRRIVFGKASARPVESNSQWCGHARPCGRDFLASRMSAGMLPPAMWIVIAVFAVGVAFLIGFVVGRRFPSRQDVGEALVAETISVGLQRPHVLINNVTLRSGERNSQIDHVLVLDTGIFVIETKHYTGWIFGEPDMERWTQVIYRKKSRFQNPVRQNFGHVKALQALFSLPSDGFSSVVVFTGDAEFKTDLGPTVLKLPQLLEHLGKERPVKFDERQMAHIVGRIEMKRLRRSLETDEYHLNYVRRRVARKLSS